MTGTWGSAWDLRTSTHSQEGADQSDGTPSPLSESLDMNFTFHLNWGRSQENLAKNQLGHCKKLESIHFNLLLFWVHSQEGCVDSGAPENLLKERGVLEENL